LRIWSKQWIKSARSIDIRLQGRFIRACPIPVQLKRKNGLDS
jgi:hypothetical protein